MKRPPLYRATYDQDLSSEGCDANATYQEQWEKAQDDTADEARDDERESNN